MVFLSGFWACSRFALLVGPKKAQNTQFYIILTNIFLSPVQKWEIFGLEASGMCRPFLGPCLSCQFIRNCLNLAFGQGQKGFWALYRQSSAVLVLILANDPIVAFNTLQPVYNLERTKFEKGLYGRKNGVWWDARFVDCQDLRQIDCRWRGWLACLEMALGHRLPLKWRVVRPEKLWLVPQIRRCVWQQPGKSHSKQFDIDHITLRTISRIPWIFTVNYLYQQCIWWNIISWL
jgi:hypothetical protein